MTTRNISTTPFDLDQLEKESMADMLNLLENQEDFSRDSLIQATVIETDKEYVYLNIGKKQEGRCPLSEFKEAPRAGAEISVVVQQSSTDGPVKLSHREADRRISWQTVQEAYENSIQLTGKIARAVNHGYIVEMEGLELFLPLSQSIAKTGPRNKFANGKSIDFKILELKDKHRSAIISHRVIVEERNDSSWNELLENHNVGDVVEGRVSKIVSFGVFIRVGNIEGLLHQSDISWKKFARFKGRFKKDDTVTVKILSMDKENNRLSLGLKQLTEDPWEWAARELAAGKTVSGKVSSITDYGAFIEIREGLEGLVHVSELTWAKRVKHPKKYLQLGQDLEATVLGLDLEAKRISLGIRQLQEDPWNNIDSEFNVGDVHEGEITSITKFGAFVKLKEDVEGLIHFNDYTWDDRIDRKMIKKGESCRFKILEINASERRISCGIKQLTPSPYEELRRKYRNGTVLECKITSITPFGIFAMVEEGYEGLIHISNIPLRSNEKLEDHYSVGDTVTAVLQKIDVEAKKIALSIKAFVRKQDQEVYNQYIKKDDQPSTSSLGAFIKSSELNNEDSVS